MKKIITFFIINLLPITILFCNSDEIISLNENEVISIGTKEIPTLTPTIIIITPTPNESITPTPTLTPLPTPQRGGYYRIHNDQSMMWNVEAYKDEEDVEEYNKVFIKRSLNSGEYTDYFSTTRNTVNIYYEMGYQTGRFWCIKYSLSEVFNTIEKSEYWSYCLISPEGEEVSEGCFN